jgi:5-methylcytosine-specific restriction protein B
MTSAGMGGHTAWFVGASGDAGDYTARFIAEGIWENGYTDRYLDLVRSMRLGERIAIKSVYTRKRGLPFDNKGETVSVMAIKAVGVITENMNDGRHVRVNWTAVDPPREWYFNTYRGTIWRVQPDDFMKAELIAFAFEGKAQNIDKFRNAPFWSERFGDKRTDEQRFVWTRFYQAMADKLLAFKDDRRPLLEELQRLASRVDVLDHLAKDNFSDGATGFVRDICPFTVLGLFNRHIRESSRRAVAKELATILGVAEPVPESFEGIPLLNNMKSWLFPREKKRAPDHIDSLWKVFAAAIQFADSGSDEARAAFAAAFDGANGREIVGWNLTFGLYWSRPWSFVSLDANSQQYISRKLGIKIGLHGPKNRCSASDYLSVMDTLNGHFEEASYPVHSFPELSLEAWRYRDPIEEPAPLDLEESDDSGESIASPKVYGVAEALVSGQPYDLSDVIKDGCFIDQRELERILGRLKAKKNLILQGPPGTGKTWLARRLGFALVGRKDDRNVRAVQFHPNLSYEDFVRGWRPAGDGKLVMADGIFMEAIQAAAAEPSSKFVLVIEEINRGNPAQIFGELLTLIESSKRGPGESLELSYRKHAGERVHVPENLFVIGTMNVADRSLALVDLALRRRFAFVDLQPQLGLAWRTWITEKCGIDAALASDIERRMNNLNVAIAADPRLGPQFRIGHSYVTPTEQTEDGATRDWFVQIVETEIGPLLDEYWFDAPAKSRQAREILLKEW